MATLVGVVNSARGLSVKRDDLGDIASSYTLPAGNYQVEQPADIPVCFFHDRGWVVGRVDHLSRSATGGLIAVASISDNAARDFAEDPEQPWFFSSGVRARRSRDRDRYGQEVYRDAVIDEISLVRGSAGFENRPVRLLPHHDVAEQPGWTVTGLPLGWTDILDRAHDRVDGLRFRRAPDHLLIDELDPAPEPAPPPAAPVPAVAPVAHRRTAPTKPKQFLMRYNGVELNEAQSIASAAEMGYAVWGDGTTGYSTEYVGRQLALDYAEEDLAAMARTR